MAGDQDASNSTNQANKTHVNLKPPDNLIFEGNVAELWKRWIKKFTHYLTGIEATNKDGEVKVAILLHTLGEEAQEKFDTFELTAEERKKYDKVVQAFEDYCTPKKNETVARFNFFQRRQREGESLDDFVTDLKKLSIDCTFGDLKSSLIKDQIVSGIQCEQMQDRLLREDDLTLDKCIKMCKAAELASKRVETLRGKEEINAVQQRNTPQNFNNYGQRTPRTHSEQKTTSTRNLDKTGHHSRSRTTRNFEHHAVNVVINICIETVRRSGKFVTIVRG